MKCPVCACNVLSKHSHRLYKSCQNCFALFQVEEIHEIKDYYSTQNLDNRSQIGSYRTYLDIMSQYLRYDNESSLIDIGAGDGTFLEMCQKQLDLENIYAIESSELAKRQLTGKGIKLLTTDQLATMGHKVVTALQVLEHILKPKEFIESLGLQKGDYLVLTSPAVDSIYCRYYRKYWKSLSPSHHVVLYSRKAIEVLCQKSELELIFYDLCISANHGLIDSALKYTFSLLKWPIKIFLFPAASFPLFHGRNSFLVICLKH